MFETTRTLDDLTLDNVLYHVYLRFFERDRFFGTPNGSNGCARS
jgi:hypothetical protein